MKKSIYDFKRKYAVQDELLNEGALDGLDERTRTKIFSEYR